MHDQNSAIDTKRPSSPSHFCGDAQALFLAFFKDLKLLVDVSSQGEQEEKKARVDKQQTAIDATQSSSQSQVVVMEFWVPPVRLLCPFQ